MTESRIRLYLDDRVAAAHALEVHRRDPRYRPLLIFETPWQDISDDDPRIAEAEKAPVLREAVNIPLPDTHPFARGPMQIKEVVISPESATIRKPRKARADT